MLRQTAVTEPRQSSRREEFSCNTAEVQGSEPEDQHQQLMNTIQVPHLAYALSCLRQKRESDPEEVARLEADMKSLKSLRRSAPPRLLMRGHRVTLQIPFLSPDRKTLLQVLGEKEYTALAGVDRGVRVPVALSVQEDGDYLDELLRVEYLLEKRERLREQASLLNPKWTGEGTTGTRNGRGCRILCSC